MLFTDHIGREINIPAFPQRIISLCPSLTSTMVALGVGEKLVGRTQFCIHPEAVVKGIPTVGGTKNLKQERVEAVQPDLVICEKEENTPEMVQWLSERFPVFVTEVRNLEDSRRMVIDLGRITGTESAAIGLSAEIEDAMRMIAPVAGQHSVLYFIWRKPWMVAGKDTFINSVLEHMGFQNLAKGMNSRYPEVGADTFSMQPEFVFLSSEPFPFEQKHFEEIRALFPSASVILVDGEMFSWYGENQRKLPEYWMHLRVELESGIVNMF